MSKTVFSTGPHTGQVVYINYTPRVVGRIIEFLPLDSPKAHLGASIHVRWLRPYKGAKSTWVSVLSLGDFVSLVEETERKAKNHRRILTQVMDEVDIT